MSVDPFEADPSADNRQRLWGFAVLIAIAVIVLPLLLDGAGSESKFRRVEKLREEPPRILDGMGNSTVLEIPTSERENSAEMVEPDLVDVSDDSTLPPGAEEVISSQAKPADYIVEPAETSDNPSEETVTNISADSTTERTEQIIRSRLELAAAESQQDLAAAANQTAQVAGVESAAATEENSEQSALAPGSDNLTAWVVLAGAFDQEPDALLIRDQLRKEGFASFVRDREQSDDPYQVLVGPMIKEQGALDALVRVANLLGGSPVVMSYP